MGGVTPFCVTFSRVSGYKNLVHMANSSLFSSSQECLEVSASSSKFRQILQSFGKFQRWKVSFLPNHPARTSWEQRSAGGRPERRAGGAAHVLSATSCTAATKQAGAESLSTTDLPGTESQYSSRVDPRSNGDRAEFEPSRPSVSD